MTNKELQLIAASVAHQLRQAAEQVRTPVLLRVVIMALTIAAAYHPTTEHLHMLRAAAGHRPHQAIAWAGSLATKGDEYPDGIRQH